MNLKGLQLLQNIWDEIRLLKMSVKIVLIFRCVMVDVFQSMLIRERMHVHQ